MTDDVQPLEPPAELLRVAREVTHDWMRRNLDIAVRRGGGGAGHDHDGFDRIVAEAAGRVLADLADLLSTDVDDQRSTPLSIYRDAVARPTAWLRSIGIVEPPSDPARPVGLPDDPYRLGPDTWSDIDPALHAPGLTWGAWKAMIVLRRRRDEGQR